MSSVDGHGRYPGQMGRPAWIVIGAILFLLSVTAAESPDIGLGVNWIGPLLYGGLACACFYMAGKRASSTATIVPPATGVK